MAALIDGLTAIAEERFGKKDPRRALRTLYVSEEESPGSIGRRFGCTATGVRYLLKKWGIKRKRTIATGIHKNLKALGFRTLEAYFRARWSMTKEEMGAELGVSPVTVARHYNAWAEGIEGRK